MPARFDLIGIVVHDMPRALAFYRQLGFTIPSEMDKEGHVEAQLPGGLRIAWDTEEVVRSFMPDWRRADNGHGIGMAFLCESAADVDVMYTHLVDFGAASYQPPFDAPWGQRYAQIYDPDHNLIDLFAPLG